ncbi:hypothetical protein [Klebsiella pneumoniae IS10]|nr:hypothetical protein [Klebsiella pneumoniae IS10]CDL50564.1 hypothetical protein [Klebsiella pneumoniae ISC21]
MLFIDDNAASSVERAASPCIDEKQHAFTGIQFCQLGVVFLDQRFGIFTRNEIDPANVFLLAQQHFCCFQQLFCSPTMCAYYNSNRHLLPPLLS